MILSYMNKLLSQAHFHHSYMQGSMKISMLSPGIIYEPYAPREPLSFVQRLVSGDYYSTCMLAISWYII